MKPLEQILVVDDDRGIRDLVCGFLGKHGYRVLAARDGREMLAALAASRIDLIVLDLMLPGKGGLELCRDLRARSAVPIIMLTAIADESDRILGLEMGADDYLAKPFNARELLARVRSVLRRAAGPGFNGSGAPAVLGFAGWRLDLARRRLESPDGVLVGLTSGEFDLLAAFAEHPGRVLTREQLLDLARGRDATAFDRSIDVQVSRLRRKIEADPANPQFILTVRGNGYSFAAPVAPVAAAAP
jgi:two-component system OmpR family response regulator